LFLKEIDLARALVVEDDVSSSVLVSMLLQQHGFETFTADNAVDALLVIENQEGISVILLDILLPGLSGMSLLESLRKDYPEISVLIVSAHVDTDPTALAAIGDTPQLRKPFSKHQFDEAIRQLGVLPS
jgi:DNA-binding NtrC family response regulator